VVVVGGHIVRVHIGYISHRSTTMRWYYTRMRGSRVTTTIAHPRSPTRRRLTATVAIRRIADKVRI